MNHTASALGARASMTLDLDSDALLALGSQPSADDRATEFSAVTGETGEQYNGYTLMVEAYAAIWLILMVWLAFLWRKQQSLTSRIDGLEAALARAERRVAGKAKAKDPAPATDVEKRKEPETETSA